MRRWHAALLALFVGWIIARRWPDHPWRQAALIVGMGVAIGQGLEPVLEVLLYEGRFGYDAEPDRWRAFAVCLAAGVAALALALVLCRPRANVAPA